MIQDAEELFHTLLVVFMIGSIAYAFYRLLRWVEWQEVGRFPVETVKARVVAKRTEVSGFAANNTGSTHTTYFCTFELSTGERKEFRVSGKLFGVLAEGDRGELTYQGCRLKGFVRKQRP